MGSKEIERIKQEIQILDIKQQAIKILMNSCYGALGTRSFRYFDVDKAEAITITGKYCILSVRKEINNFLNNLLDTNEKDYICGSDTDSVYIELKNDIKKFIPEEKDEKKICDFLNQFCNQNIAPIIDNFCKNAANYFNCSESILKMNREKISKNAIWIAKKNYILNVFDNEGIFVNGKIKSKGIDLVKASTPKFFKENMGEAISLILNKENDDLIRYINSIKKKLSEQNELDIAFIKSINNMDRYSDKQSIYGNKCPMQVRAGLLYNHLIKKYKLQNKYPFIKEREKIKYVYLKPENPIKENIIGFLQNIPIEFGLNKYIDYETQFERGFIKPLNRILEPLGWRTEKIVDIGDLF